MANEVKTTKAAQAKSARPPLFQVEADTIERMNARIVELEQQLKRLETATKSRQVLTGDDQFFLTWVLGFTAGANLERDGERGERIYARCRAIHEKIAPITMPAAPHSAHAAMGGS